MNKSKDEYYWQRFHQEEMSLLSWMAINSRCLLNADDQSLVLDKDAEAPSFIRQIHIVPFELLDEAVIRYEKVKMAFLDASESTNDNKLRLPSRLPQIFTNVERIIHSSYPAYQSIKLKPTGECDLYRSDPESGTVGFDCQKACVKLQVSGLTSAYVRHVPSHGCHAVTVNSEQFFEWANCQSIQRRLPTGCRYEARITQFDSKPVRTHLGLILLCQDTEPFIEKSLPRRKRSDAETKKEIVLPISSKYSFYVNE